MAATDTFSAETQEKFKNTDLWKPWMSEVRLRQATSIEEVEEFLEAGCEAPVFSWDLETSSLDPHPDKVVGHCVAFNPNEGLYIPTRHLENSQANLDHDRVWQLILQAIRVPNRLLTVYNWKFEGKCLRYLGEHFPATTKTLADVYIYVWLADSNVKQLGLKISAQRLLGKDMLNIEDVPGAKVGRKKTDINFAYTNPEEATLYAAADPVFTLALLNMLYQPVQDSQAFICSVEHELLDAIFMLESNKSMFDRAFLRRGEEDLKRWANVLASEIYQVVGYQFNLASPAQVAKALLSQKVELNKTEKGNYKTGADEIEKLADEHPICGKITQYRSLVKEIGTYVQPLLRQTTEEDPTGAFKFTSVGAPTGRFSSGGVDPGETYYMEMNAQSIPNANAYQGAVAWDIANPPDEDLDLAQLEGMSADEENAHEYVEVSEGEEESEEE
jgi:DNA polymerase-1